MSQQAINLDFLDENYHVDRELGVGMKGQATEARGGNNWNSRGKVQTREGA